MKNFLCALGFHRMAPRHNLPPGMFVFGASNHSVMTVNGADAALEKWERLRASEYLGDVCERGCGHTTTPSMEISGEPGPLDFERMGEYLRGERASMT